MDDKYTGWIAAAVLGIGGVVKVLMDWRGNRDSRADKTRADALAEWKGLYEEQQKDVAKLEARVDQLQLAHSSCERKYERASERIGHLEEALANAGIKFRPWVEPTGDTGPHRPLPKPEGRP